jgi:2',3'-cyclic-nucleotide 2'-phosphodiesterase/3'-nucleotidase
LDVLLIGHSHEQFPDPDGPASATVDPIAGTLHAKPAVMAGFYGTSLGVIALDLGWTPRGWRVQGRSVRLQNPTQRRKSAQRREIELLAANAHTATLAHIRTPIAQTAVPIQNYFATIQPDLAMQLLAQAMRDALPENLRQTPVVAAVSPFQFGGRNGLGHFIDIPAGQVTLRDAAAIFPFSDTLCAVRRSGAQIRDWLERSAAHYNQISANTFRQDLLNPRSAGYHCDALYGLTYAIDLSQPARFDVWGKLISPSASRIRDIALDGKPVADDDFIIVAANSFRASGGGGFAAIPDVDVLWRTRERLRDILIDALQKRAQITEAVQPVWRFCPIAGAHAQFQSALQAKEHITDAMSHIGAGDNGFETYSFAF